MRLRSLTVLPLLATAAPAEVEREIPWGVEVVTGYRSEYIQRGFKLANDLFDVQGEAEIALADDVFASFGGWYGTGTGSADFEELGAFGGIRWETGKFILGLDTGWTSIDHSVFKDGLDVSPSLTWLFTKDLEFTAGAAWNTGADGLYGFAETVWSKPLGTSSFVSLTGGISAVADYYGRDGWNDVHARASFTQSINQRVAVTPYVGVSIPLQSDGETNRLFGGVWFEVNF